MTEGGKRKKCGGTPNWKAPESLGGIFGFPADCFSFGLILWSMIKQREPVQISYHAEYFDMEIPSIPGSVNDFVVKVLEPLLLVDPKSRRSIDGFLSNFNECKELLGNISEDDWNELCSFAE